MGPSLDDSTSSPPSLSTSTSTLALHSYHCLCSTHLLTTPYVLSDLHQRACPSLDRARILPFPSPSSASQNEQEDQVREETEEGQQQQQQKPSQILPSLLSTNVKPVRKLLAVQREDGWEKRRLWRCGRCGVAVGYEILGEEEPAGVIAGGKKEGDVVGKVLFLLEGGLVETGKWDD
ncbi:MAG: hypothetical protein L6R36_003517 [Xanthoria steineri]|nr:MAG: hypothetical protein L6R36_003517 [Xanthoria steineri]